jgi:hypothetical protein
VGRAAISIGSTPTTTCPEQYRDIRVTPSGTWSTNVMMRDAERALALQAEASYKRMVQDQKAGGPTRKVGASVSMEHA